MVNKESLHPSDVLLVICNTPDEACAQSIARELVEQQLAACVNILTPCRSIYRWQDIVEEAFEIPLLIKTTRAAYDAVEETVKTLHPYEVPEIIALPLEQGLPAYLDWVRSNVD